MFNNSQRNFEWFEVSFSKKIRNIINENNSTTFEWIRDTNVTISLALLSLACQIWSENGQKEKVQKVLNFGTIFFFIFLLVWLIICVFRYALKFKRIQNIKKRVIPHNPFIKMTSEECIQLFDNDICNELVLSKSYLKNAINESDDDLIEFYLIEAVHYFYKSIKSFCDICNSNELTEIFSYDKTEATKKINIIRLENYYYMLNSTKIIRGQIKNGFDFSRVEAYVNSFECIRMNCLKTWELVNRSFTEFNSLLSSNVADIL